MDIVRIGPGPLDQFPVARNWWTGPAKNWLGLARLVPGRVGQVEDPLAGSVKAHVGRIMTQYMKTPEDLV